MNKKTEMLKIDGVSDEVWVTFYRVGSLDLLVKYCSTEHSAPFFIPTSEMLKITVRRMKEWNLGKVVMI